MIHLFRDTAVPLSQAVACFFFANIRKTPVEKDRTNTNKNTTGEDREKQDSLGEMNGCLEFIMFSEDLMSLFVLLFGRRARL